MAQTVKRLSAMLETWVQSLGWEDPLENSYIFYDTPVKDSIVLFGASLWKTNKLFLDFNTRNR